MVHHDIFHRCFTWKTIKSWYKIFIEPPSKTNHFTKINISKNNISISLNQYLKRVKTKKYNIWNNKQGMQIL